MTSTGVLRSEQSDLGPQCLQQGRLMVEQSTVYRDYESKNRLIYLLRPADVNGYKHMCDPYNKGYMHVKMWKKRFENTAI